MRYVYLVNECGDGLYRRDRYDFTDTSRIKEFCNDLCVIYSPDRQHRLFASAAEADLEVRRLNTLNELSRAINKLDIDSLKSVLEHVSKAKEKAFSESDAEAASVS